MRTTLESSTLIRDIYRSLLNRGRTYASFESRHSSLLSSLNGLGTILDPMSGYGGLMNFCCRAEFTCSSFGIELNPPAFYWQVLMAPQNRKTYITLCFDLLRIKDKWPKADKRLAFSKDWFPEYSFDLLVRLWELISSTINSKTYNYSVEELTIAFLLPFSGRLSSSIKGNVTTHVTKGGFCPYGKWEEDFSLYVAKLSEVLLENQAACNNNNQIVIHDDARSCNLGELSFSAMLTSPPYPNREDYYKMFSPENALLDKFQEAGFLPKTGSRLRLIGAAAVSENDGHIKNGIDDIRSKTAIEFLEFIKSYSKTNKAINDNRNYYLPYYCNYFTGLEKAYKNISKYLADEFLGYIVVVNNTARKKIIPVAKIVCDIWNDLDLGFKAEIVPEYSAELAHVGGLNPRVKGLNARHMEYTVRVIR